MEFVINVVESKYIYWNDGLLEVCRHNNTEITRFILTQKISEKYAK